MLQFQTPPQSRSKPRSKLSEQTTPSLLPTKRASNFYPYRASGPMDRTSRTSDSLPQLLDLTKGIVRLDSFANRGGGFADVYKAQWRSEYVSCPLTRLIFYLFLHFRLP